MIPAAAMIIDAEEEQEELTQSDLGENHEVDPLANSPNPYEYEEYEEAPLFVEGGVPRTPGAANETIQVNPCTPRSRISSNERYCF